MSHASCILDENLFVFAGEEKHQGSTVPSIEMLSLRDRHQWVLLQEGNKLLSRHSFVVTPISSYEILIVGGKVLGYSVADVIVFNAESKTIGTLKSLPNLDSYVDELTEDPAELD